MSAYADTSFLVPLFIPDTHSPEAERRLTAASPLFLTPLHIAEWSHAVEQLVFRKAISRRDADSVRQQFQEQRANGFGVEVAVPENAFTTCAEMARRHGARTGIGTLDALHVAFALLLHAERFWTFDRRQAKLARAEGLRIR